MLVFVCLVTYNYYSNRNIKSICVLFFFEKKKRICIKSLICLRAMSKYTKAFLQKYRISLGGEWVSRGSSA